MHCDFAEFVEDFCREFEIRADGLDQLESHVDEFLRNKKSGQIDSEQVQRIKGLIRRGEARDRCAMLRRQRRLSPLP